MRVRSVTVATLLTASCPVAGGVARGVIGADTATGECVEIEHGTGLAVTVLHLPRSQPVKTAMFKSEQYAESDMDAILGACSGLFAFGADQRELQALARRSRCLRSLTGRSVVALGGLCGVDHSHELYHRPSGGGTGHGDARSRAGTTSGCLFVAFSGGERSGDDESESIVPAVTRGTAPVGPAFRVVRCTPGDERGIQWIFAFEQLPHRTSDPDASDEEGYNTGDARIVWTARELIQVILAQMQDVRQPMWLGCCDGAESQAAGGASHPFEMLDVIGFEDGAEVDGNKRGALAVAHDVDMEGAVVQFHHLSAAASRTELLRCAESIRDDLKPRSALGAFAAVCNGRGEKFHGPGHPAADTSILRRGLGGSLSTVGFFADGELGPGATGEASGRDIHISSMMGFTSVFGVLTPSSV